jgi:hypothetical protein
MDIGLAREDAMIPLAPPMITAARPSANAGCCGMRSTITFFAMRKHRIASLVVYQTVADFEVCR